MSVGFFAGKSMDNLESDEQNFEYNARINR